MKPGQAVKTYQSQIIATFLVLAMAIIITNYSFSPGERYFAKWKNFQKVVSLRDWEIAKKLERGLYPEDIQKLKSDNYPEYLLIKIKDLESQTPQTVDTQIQISRLYLRLQQVEAAKSALKVAIKLDPLREDIKIILSSL